MNHDDHIRSLSSLEHVRLRPGMYVGGIDSRAMHHLVYEVLDHMVEEALVGRCDHIWIELRDGQEISIRDNSAGLPVKQYKDTPLIQMQALLQTFGLRKTQFEPGIYQYQIMGGLHGLGLAVVTILTAKMRVQNRREGFLWEQTYEKGLPQSPLAKSELADPDETGTTFTFVPDYTIFDQNDFDRAKLQKRAEHLTYLNPGLSITLTDLRVKPRWQKTFFAPEGLKTFVASLRRKAKPLHDLIHIREDLAIPRPDKPDINVSIEIAFQFSKADSAQIFSYANTVETFEGGTHLEAFKSVLLNHFNEYLDRHPEKFEATPRFTWAEISRGLVAAVSVRLPSPTWSTPTKIILRNPEVFGPVAGLVFTALFNQNWSWLTQEELVKYHLRKRKSSR